MVSSLGEIHIVMGDVLFFLHTNGIWVLQGITKSPLFIRHNLSNAILHRHCPSILYSLQRHRHREDDHQPKPNFSSVSFTLILISSNSSRSSNFFLLQVFAISFHPWFTRLHSMGYYLQGITPNSTSMLIRSIIIPYAFCSNSSY